MAWRDTVGRLVERLATGGLGVPVDSPVSAIHWMAVVEGAGVGDVGEERLGRASTVGSPAFRYRKAAMAWRETVVVGLNRGLPPAGLGVPVDSPVSAIHWMAS